jgi:hypothetical protein
MFILLPLYYSHFEFFLLIFFSLCYLSSLSSTSSFIDVYFPTSLLLPFCIFFVVIFFFIVSSFSFKHYKSFTSYFSNGGFHFVVFFFVTFIFSFKPHVVTSCFFDVISFYFLVFFKQLIKGVMFSSSPFNLVVCFKFYCFRMFQVFKTKL